MTVKSCHLLRHLISHHLSPVVTFPATRSVTCCHLLPLGEVTEVTLRPQVTTRGDA